MKKKFGDLNTYLKCAIVTLSVGIIVTAVLGILSVFQILDFFIPLGIILGILIISGSYFALYKIGSVEEENKKLTFSMVVTGLRLFLLVVLAVLEAILQLKLNITLFNPFAFIGAYIFGSTVSIIFQVLEKKKC